MAMVSPYTGNWQEETEQLRKLLVDCQLTEALKWGKPTFLYEDKNIVQIQGFKAYCALLFFKGSLLSNEHGLLVKTGENTVVGRQIRFTSVKEIAKHKAAIKASVYEAIEAEKAGLKVETVQKEAPACAEEFQQKLDTMPALKKAFEALTPGRQKAYHIYFSQPKQSQTRQARVEKYMQHILQGRGIND